VIERASESKLGAGPWRGSATTLPRLSRNAGSVRQRVAKQLHGYRAAGQDMLGTPHLTHAALAQQPFETVLRIEHLTQIFVGWHIAGIVNRKQQTGNSKQETGNRKQETGNRRTPRLLLRLRVQDVSCYTVWDIPLPGFLCQFPVSCFQFPPLSTSARL